jgi:hypothetical protein
MTEFHPRYHLAQLNIARALAPLNSPVMAEFVAALNEINALADAAPGFVWRLQDSAGNATSLRPYPDPLMIVNLSVWDSLTSLKQYAYHSQHTQFVRRRHEWFDTLTQPYLALWWIEPGRVPSLAEARERLEHLRQRGETHYAFSFQKPYGPEQGP